MRAFTVTAAQLAQCPRRLLLPAHFRDDGSCRCFPAAALVPPCPRCGQKANEPPGFRLTDDGPEALMTEEVTVLDPQVLECRSCGSRRLVPRDSVERVRRPDGTPFPLEAP